jgi:hypothetical protein
LRAGGHSQAGGHGAESFEEFLCRYWIREEVWFAINEGDPLPIVPEKILALYR